MGGPAIGTYVEAPRQHAAQVPVLLAPRPALLAGREELLSELDARLSAGDVSVPRVVVLCGLGGAGKTSVAVEYAYRHLAEVGLAWQFATEDGTVLAAGFAQLAAQIGERGLADARDPVVSVHAVLAGSAAPWLVILDNAADLASVAGFLPPAGPGRVLITSQNAAWPGQVLEVPVLGQDAAAGFLVSRSGDQDRQAAWDLAGELGGLPLALEQAAAYVQATGGNLVGYLAAFRRRRADVLGRGEPTGYRGTVATTWRLAFDDLARAAPSAAGLLRLMAFCAPEAIPLRPLLQPRPGLAGQLGDEVAPLLVPLLEDELAAGDAIAALRRYSLVTLAAGGLASVHRLVQAVTVAQMPAGLATAWRQAVAAVIEAALPDDSLLSENWPVFAALLPHAQAALTDESGGMWRIAQYLGWSGSYAAARDLFQRVLDANMRVLGPEHPETLAVCCDLAHYIGQEGDAAGARDQFTALLPVFERVLGPEHPATLSTRGYLARWTGEAGDAAGARDQYADVLPMDERVSGAEHPETLAVRANLAYNTGLAGDAAGARDQYAALLPVRERVSGAEHRETLAIQANLARWTGLAGDAAGAHHQFAALQPVFERVLGAEHPETLKIRANLAYWTGKAGDAAGARDQYADVLPMEERASGTEHPETLKARGNLARWTGEAGDAADARDQFAALLPVFERVSGVEHPDTLTVRGYLARWTGEAGNAAGAQHQYAALLPVRERVSGAEHPETLKIRANLAYWTSKASSDPDSRVK